MNYQINKAEQAVATIIFAHGAGADMDSDYMTEITLKLVANNVNVLRFNFPYMSQRKLDGKRRPPNRMPILLAELQDYIDQYSDDLPLFVGGKSMGSRVAATLVNQQKVTACFCIGYPFHPQKQPQKLRLEPLQNSEKPILIVQGSRDALGNKDEISEYDLADHIDIKFLEDGDHDLKPRIKSGFNHQQHKDSAVEFIVDFVKGAI